MTRAEGTCAHCGLPAPPGVLSFCCRGCKAAYELFHDAGLEHYYTLRERTGSPSGTPRDVDEPVDRYAHYDDTEFLHANGGRQGCVDLRVDGIECAACVWALEQLPRVLPGVAVARVSLGSRRLHLEWDPERIQPSRIARFLHGLGYATHVLSLAAEDERARVRRRELLRLGVAGALAGNIMLMAVAMYAGEFSSIDGEYVALFQWLSLLLAIPVLTYAAWPFHRGAWAGLRLRSLHMDLPISLGLLAGFGASAFATFTGEGPVYFDSLATLVFLLLLGRRVQRWGQERAITASELLHVLTPPAATRLEAGLWNTVAVTKLRVGDVLRVNAGERFAADGELERGRSHVDLSSLTGESRPVPIAPGSRVFAGCTNLSGVVEMRASAWGHASRIGTLVEHIERAGVERSPTVQLADRIAGYFVATVIVVAVVAGWAWWHIDSSRVFEVVVALLVVSCPCALGLATPLALSVARARAAREGILIKTPSAVDGLARTRTVVLDKTGTLTCGRSRVAAYAVLEGFDMPSVARCVEACERSSSHPLARALYEWALERVPAAANTVLEVAASLPGEAVQEVAGAGVRAVIDGQCVRIGRLGWIDDSHPEVQRFVAQAVAQRHTPVLCEVEGRVAAMFALGDELRAEAPSVIQYFRDRGMRVVLRSGDHPAIVEAVARVLGIDDAKGGMSPEDKAAEIRTLADAAMVGDGINDAPALRAATIGIAVRGGAEVAMDVADVFVARGGLAPVVTAFEGARRTANVVKRNLAFSLAYNVVFATLAVAGFVTPLVAAILMPASSLTVVLSSMGARTFGGLSFRARMLGRRTLVVLVASTGCASAQKSEPPPAVRSGEPARHTVAEDDARKHALERKQLAVAHTDRGTIAYRAGHFDEALQAFDEAMAIVEATQDADPMELGRLHHHRAQVLSAMGAHERAAVACNAALEIAHRTKGPLDPLTFSMRAECASVLVDAGRLDEAERLLAVAEADVQSAASDAMARTRAAVLHGQIEHARGRHVEAIAAFERAIDTYTHAKTDPEHARAETHVVSADGEAHSLASVDLEFATWVGLAKARLAVGQSKRAIEALLHASKLPSPGQPAKVAEFHFVFAKALTHLSMTDRSSRDVMMDFIDHGNPDGQPNLSSQSHAQLALDGYRKAGKYFTHAVAEVQAWAHDHAIISVE